MDRRNGGGTLTGDKKTPLFLKETGQVSASPYILLHDSGWSRANGLSNSGLLYHDYHSKSTKNRKNAARFFQDVIHIQHCLPLALYTARHAGNIPLKTIAKTSLTV
jgi:hypothetical protein